MTIKSKFLNHKGGFYYYTLHEPKLSQLSQDSFQLLNEFLQEMMEDCPEDCFNNGPRGSCLKFQIPADTLQITGHEISKLTLKGLEHNRTRYKQAHSKVQSFLIEMDNSTIATEVPVWASPEELKSHISTNSVLTGHIDLLRIEDGKIWVWDYKPNAFKEKYASTQVYFYAIMLSKRTNIPLSEFRCGYFDSDYAFIFNPSEVKLDQTTLTHP